MATAPASESFCWNPNPPPVPHLSVRPKASRMEYCINCTPALYKVPTPLCLVYPCVHPCALYKVPTPLCCRPRPCIRSAEPWAKAAFHVQSFPSSTPTSADCPAMDFVFLYFRICISTSLYLYVFLYFLRWETLQGHIPSPVSPTHTDQVPPLAFWHVRISKTGNGRRAEH